MKKFLCRHRHSNGKLKDCHAAQPTSRWRRPRTALQNYTRNAISQVQPRRSMFFPECDPESAHQPRAGNSEAGTSMCSVCTYIRITHADKSAKIWLLYSLVIFLNITQTHQCLWNHWGNKPCVTDWYTN